MEGFGTGKESGIGTYQVLLTLAEYLGDYASATTKEKGHQLIAKKVAGFNDERFKGKLIERLRQIKQGATDLYF
jgi:2-iminoacetate synthase